MIEITEKGADRVVNFKCGFCGTKFCSDEYRIIGLGYLGAWELSTECPMCHVGVRENVLRKDGHFVSADYKSRNK